MTLLRWLLLLFIMLMGWHFCAPTTATVVYHSPEVIIEQLPQQSPSQAHSFQHQGFQVTPLADFALSARVLSRKDYHFGKESKVSPTDLVLGWGALSDPKVIEHISIRQSGRWYFWQVEQFPVPRRVIETHSANMHLIPANKEVADSLKTLKPGSLISLQGYLVQLDAVDGWRWRSSLTREDTGANACELIYVQHLQLLSDEN